jgi:transcriptional regulator with XRE-family HTH domain
MPRQATIHPTDPIARRLFFSRIAVGILAQGAYARAAGISPSLYNELEQAKKSLTARVLRQLQSKYGLPPEWLLDGITDRLPHGTVKKLEALGAFDPPRSNPHPPDPPPEKIIRTSRK